MIEISHYIVGPDDFFLKRLLWLGLETGKAEVICEGLNRYETKNTKKDYALGILTLLKLIIEF
jgi:hypothetical protein